MSGVLKMRPARPEDEPFLKRLRAQVDAERLYLQYWDEGQEDLKKEILDLQYRAHTAHYKDVKTQWETKDNVIELDETPVGRFIITGDKNEIRLADIAVDRAYRGMGIGQVVIDTTKAECVQSKRPLRLYVDRNNTSMQFYLKQGFKVVEDCGTHLFMEWLPPNMPEKPLYFFGS